MGTNQANRGASAAAAAEISGSGGYRERTVPTLPSKAEVN